MSDSAKDDEESHGDDEAVGFNTKRREESERSGRDYEAKDGASRGGRHDGEHEENTVGKNITAFELNPRRLSSDASRDTLILQDNVEM